MKSKTERRREEYELHKRWDFAAGHRARSRGPRTTRRREFSQINRFYKGQEWVLPIGTDTFSFRANHVVVTRIDRKRGVVTFGTYE